MFKGPAAGKPLTVPKMIIDTIVMIHLIIARMSFLFLALEYQLKLITYIGLKLSLAILYVLRNHSDMTLVIIILFNYSICQSISVMCHINYGNSIHSYMVLLISTVTVSFSASLV